jgi:hypothetical protein
MYDVCFVRPVLIFGLFPYAPYSKFTSPDMVGSMAVRSGATQSAFGADKGGQLLVRTYVRRPVNSPNVLEGVSGGLKFIHFAGA